MLEGILKGDEELIARDELDCRDPLTFRKTSQARRSRSVKLTGARRCSNTCPDCRRGPSRS
eukprot:506757-Hanusia_phi.AAC.1